jgi:drug/metabolite transporter (DMT)-like permease
LVAAVTFAIVAAVVHVMIRRDIAAIAANSRVIWCFIGSGIVCAIALFTYSWLTDGFTAARAPYLLGFGFLLGFLLAGLAIGKGKPSIPSLCHARMSRIGDPP